DRKAPERPTGKHVEHPEHAALVVLEEAGEHVRVDARHRDVRADAEHDQRAEQEEEPALQVAVAHLLAEVGKSGRHQAFGASSGAGWAGFAFLRFSFFGLGSGLGVSWIEPPAPSIIERAPLLTWISLSETLRSSLPERITFAASASRGTTRSALSAARSISAACIDCSSLVRTSAMSLRVGDLKPRLGRRRWSGICPPSNPTLWKPPERAFCPLWPRPAVLPQPEPTPRPTRWRGLLAPGAGFSSLSFIARPRCARDRRRG